MTKRVTFSLFRLSSLLAKNIKRWRWRLMLIGVLVAGSVAVAILYSSALSDQSREKQESVQPLNMPYDVLVLLPQRQKPLTEFPALATYTPNLSGTINRGRVTSIPVTVQKSDTALAITLSSTYKTLEVWGVEAEHQFLHEGEIEGQWPGKNDEILLPAKFALEYGLKLGDTITTFYKNSYGSKEEYVFTISGLKVNDYDLDKAQITHLKAKEISGLNNDNRQFLKINGLDQLQDYTAFTTTLSRLYPGANIVFTYTPSLRLAELSKAIQSPGKWVMTLVFLFMAVAVLTLSLMSFLERKQELAILKTLGIKNIQISSLLFTESATAGFLGLVFGLLLSFFIGFFKGDKGALLGSTFLRLALLNAFFVLLFFILALIYPMALAKAAGVNQLLYAREIPLFRQSYDHMPNPSQDWLQEMKEQNLHILKLSVVDGKSLAVILRQRGDKIKKGETVAFKYSWGGFVYEEWVAPVDGLVLSYDEANGKYTIQPDDPSAPIFPYPSLTKRG